MIRNTELALPKGQLGFMSPFVWMFISSYEKLRSFLINQKTITSLVQLEYSGFDGATVPICTFTVENAQHPDFKGGYVRLSDFRGSDNQGPRTLEAIMNHDCGWFYRASTDDFKQIPGNPIAYWVSSKLRNLFNTGLKVGEVSAVKAGMATSNNERFLRLWHEVKLFDICFKAKNTEETKLKSSKWYPYNKGGGFKKWYGNNEYVVNWKNDGAEVKDWVVSNPSDPNTTHWSRRIVNTEFFFHESITWGEITSSSPSFRYLPSGFVIGNKGPSIFQDPLSLDLLSYLNSRLVLNILNIFNPTLTFNIGSISALPLPENSSFSKTKNWTQKLIDMSRLDWDSVETSWDFTKLPLLISYVHQPVLKASYQRVRAQWLEMTLEMQRLEQENNRIFIEAYGLQDELKPDVPLNEITLTCNPHYRYGSDKTEEELEALLLADTMRDLVSYAVGCMFGRYALDKPSLILANQGETIADYMKQIPEPSFPADDDNVIPLLDGDWFTDDITERFRQFLRVAFGEEHYEENLKFVEQALNVKGKREYTLRDYFLGEFYTDHIKRYKKRPIYWLFSSPKGSFNALIYMHRYRPDTISVVLNDYLREFRTKLTAHKNHLEAVSISASAAQGEKTKALKEIEKINKMIAELEEYEREVLYPLATQQIDIDLDDGVKANYPKFGAALKKIPGLDAQDE
jgi:type II restriction/modification system DNA methylase subunit YeeA